MEKMHIFIQVSRDDSTVTESMTIVNPKHNPNEIIAGIKAVTEVLINQTA